MGAGLFIWSERIYIIKKYPPHVIYTEDSTYILLRESAGNNDNSDFIRFIIN